MAKSSSRKKKDAPKSSTVRAIQKKKKLPRGYKQCGNCKKQLNIHKYVCDGCGFKHDMKKKKVDILKNLNKLTPKLLRSLIQLNEFNDISEMMPQQRQFPPTSLGKEIIAVPQELKKRRTSKSQSNSNQTIWTEGPNKCFYTTIGTHLTSICSINDDIVVSESLQKRGEMPENDKTTIRAYGLQKFHKMGQIYKGRSVLHYFRNKKLQYRVNVDEHIVAMKSVNNRTALQTGRGTVLIVDLETNLQNMGGQLPYDLDDYLQIRMSEEDQITVVQWIRSGDTDQTIRILVGTLLGHIYLYQIKEKSKELIRFFGNAHFEAVTALAQCPLSNKQQCLFASGSYDGSLSLWSTNEKECLYRVEASNRNISSLIWDHGAKFIFVVRDENQDSGVLACFFALLKNQESVALSDQIDFRLIRSTTNCVCNVPIQKAVHNRRSNVFCLIDQYQSTLRVVQLQDLRKNSIKRKKVKREDEQVVYPLSFSTDPSKMRETSNQEEEKMNQTFLPLPIIADACQTRVGGIDYAWGVTYDGTLFCVQIK